VSGRLADKTTVVTGAGAGLGRAASRLFAAEGATVVCADRDERAAASIAEAIVRDGGRALALGTDVTSPADVEEMRDATLARFGHIDGLYANAGILGVGTATEVDPVHWAQVLAVNLTGVWLSARAVLPAMEERGRGAIVTQGSVAGMVGHRAVAAYAASKGGVIALTRQMAVDYAPAGIRVNAVCPGTVRTQLVEDLYAKRAAERHTDAEEDLARTAGRYPLARLGTVDEVVPVALFLLSDEASWITGAVYTVDGGMTAS
jgi:NAD(P)-dependent dehydrogenase (short-subunit alcohol dehydrogenase family)